MVDQDMIDASDINELEEIFANQQKAKEKPQSGQNLGDVAEVIERKPKKKDDPQPTKFNDLTPNEEFNERVFPGSVLKTDPVLTPQQVQAVVAPQIKEVKVPEPVIAQPIVKEVPVSTPKKTGLTIDEMILEAANERRNAKVQKAEDEMIEEINYAKKRIFAVLMGEPLPTQTVVAPPVAKSVPQVAPVVVQQPVPAPVAIPVPKKKDFSLKTAIAAFTLFTVAGIAMFILLNSFHVFG